MIKNVPNFIFKYFPISMQITFFPTICMGLYSKREKVTHAVGIKFTFEKKVFKISTR